MHKLKFKSEYYLRKQRLCQKMQTPAITLWFPKHRFKENFYLGFFIKEKWLASQVVFLVKSKHWVLAEIWFFVCLGFFGRIIIRGSFFSESRLCTRPLFSHFVRNLDRLAGQPILWIPPWGQSCVRWLNGSTTLQSQSFLKSIKNFICK